MELWPRGEGARAPHCLGRDGQGQAGMGRDGGSSPGRGPGPCRDALAVTGAHRGDPPCPPRWRDPALSPARSPRRGRGAAGADPACAAGGRRGRRVRRGSGTEGASSTAGGGKVLPVLVQRKWGERPYSQRGGSGGSGQGAAGGAGGTAGSCGTLVGGQSCTQETELPPGDPPASGAPRGPPGPASPCQPLPAGAGEVAGGKESLTGELTRGCDENTEQNQLRGGGTRTVTCAVGRQGGPRRQRWGRYSLALPMMARM